MTEFLGKPLTVERVVDAYAKTGLKPVQRVWAEINGDTRCGCALTAVYVAEGHATFEEIDAEGDELCVLENAAPGAFTDGFDSITELLSLTPYATRNDPTFKLGVECRQAVGL